jgi:hypothetical protein
MPIPAGYVPIIHRSEKHWHYCTQNTWSLSSHIDSWSTITTPILWSIFPTLNNTIKHVKTKTSVHKETEHRSAWYVSSHLFMFETLVNLTCLITAVHVWDLGELDMSHHSCSCLRPWWTWHVSSQLFVFETLVNLTCLITSVHVWDFGELDVSSHLFMFETLVNLTCLITSVHVWDFGELDMSHHSCSCLRPWWTWHVSSHLFMFETLMNLTCLITAVRVWDLDELDISRHSCFCLRPWWTWHVSSQLFVFETLVNLTCLITVVRVWDLGELDISYHSCSCLRPWWTWHVSSQLFVFETLVNLTCLITVVHVWDLGELDMSHHNIQPYYHMIHWTLEPFPKMLMFSKRILATHIPHKQINNLRFIHPKTKVHRPLERAMFIHTGNNSSLFVVTDMRWGEMFSVCHHDFQNNSFLIKWIICVQGQGHGNL